MEHKLSEKTRQIATEALAKLGVDIQAGRRERLTEHLAIMSRFPQQPWANVLLIQAQRSDATQIASERAWRAVERSIKANEQGLLIYAPTPGPPEDPLFPTSARARYAYDISQTEGQSIPSAERPMVRPDEWGEHLRSLIAARGIGLCVDRNTELPQIASDGESARMAPGLSSTADASTLSRALAREILHQGPEAANLSRHALEAEASGVAEVVGRAVGLEINAESAAFVAHDVDNPQALARSLARIHETSAQIIAALRVRARPAVDVKDFERVQREYGARIVDSVAGFVGNRQRAEDATARAFERAWEKRATFRGDSSLRTWIEAIARNEARRGWNSPRLQISSGDTLLDSKEVAMPERIEDSLEKRDDLLHLERALASLPAKQRRALVAHVVEGLPIREIARREAVPVGTILSRIHTGKQLLRNSWGATTTNPSWQLVDRERPSLHAPPKHSGSRQSEAEHRKGREPMTWER